MEQKIIQKILELTLKLLFTVDENAIIKFGRPTFVPRTIQQTKNT